MLLHYLTIALRNLRKYRLQTLISIGGLAIGFACFALASIWIRYELTFDSFRRDAERIYIVRSQSALDDRGISDISPYPLADYLQQTFPEVEAACHLMAYGVEFEYEGVRHESFQMGIDSLSEHFFDIQLLRGSRDFLRSDRTKTAVTDRLAHRLFGDKEPMGKQIKVFDKEMEICAVVKEQELHSNYPFELVTGIPTDDSWDLSAWQTFIKLRQGTDVEAFRKKLYEHVIEDEITHLQITPLTALRYDRPDEERTYKFEHILLFALSGGLVILCALFNFLTLFSNRIRIRQRETVLRKVCGSSDGSLFVLFATEYLLTLFATFFFGMILVELVQPAFRELSEVKGTTASLYLESATYFGGITVIALLLALFPIHYFRRHSLQRALQGKNNGKGGKFFVQAGLTLQLIISIGFIFCSSVLLKQVRFLHTTDIGFARKERGSVYVNPYPDGLKEEVAQLSTVAEVFPDSLSALFPSRGRAIMRVTKWDNKPSHVKDLSIRIISCNRRYFDFYGLTLVEGKLPEIESEHILVNESAVKAMGMDNPIGKAIYSHNKKKPYIIDGVVKNFHLAPPTVPVQPVLLDFSSNFRNGSDAVIFRCHPGMENLCKQQIEQLAKRMQPDANYIQVSFAEEEYAKFFQSEEALLKLLDFVTLVCVLISLFGVFSQVTLDCEKRQREIAVRKVNGATARDIRRLFLRTYLRSLCLAALIAFPAGYLIMKRWMEQYVLQTPINWWLYPSIFAGIGILLTLCTFWRIRRAANRNPAEVIKAE